MVDKNWKGHMSKPVPVDNDANNQQAKLLIPTSDGELRAYELPIVIDVHGNSYLNASNLYAESNLKVLDECLRSTAVTESQLTYIIPSIPSNKGSQGALQYRGYSVKQLATSCSFLETAFLLIHGELPDESQFKTFSDEIKSHRLLDKQTEDMIEGFDRQSNPMIILIGTMSSLASRYESNYDMHNAEDRNELATRMIAKLPSLGAYIYKHIIGQRPIAPDESLGHSANFLHMLLSTQVTQANIEPEHIKVLDMILTLHADHQMAVSTFVARCVSSAGTPSISSITAAVAALSGPLHGGANAQVIAMLTEIDSIEDISKIIERAKDPDDAFKLYGFGHRVYKGMDPRASVLRELTLSILGTESKDDPLLDMAIKLEEAALNDPYFTDRNLYPNVDFYSGIAMRAIGIPVELFTVVFAMSRVAGWLAHIEEHWSNQDGLYRPKQFYTGLKERPLNWP